MTRAQAQLALKAFGARHGLKQLRLNAKGLAAMQIGTTPVSFEWNAGKHALVCRALVYRFAEKPKPKVLERVLHSAGSLEFVPAAHALFITERVTDDRPLDGVVHKLVAEALVWVTHKLAASA